MAPDGIHEARPTMDDPERLRELTESYLKSVIAEATGAATRGLDSAAGFGELGINSFQVLKIIKRLETDFGRLPKSLLFENFNVQDLAGYFVAKHADALAARLARDGPGAAQADTAAESAARMEAPARPPRAAPTAPILVRERDAYADPALKDLLETLFARHKLEGCVSRGTRRIAPNLFIGSARRGFFNYGRGQDVLLLYGYTGPRDYLPLILEEVQSYCASRNLQLNIFSDEKVPPISGTPFSATPFGVLQRIVGLSTFTLQGGPMRRLRYQVAAFQKCGPCRTEEYRCGSDPSTAERIAGVIERWCESRTVVNPLVRDVQREILAGALTSEHRIFLTYLRDALQNVILIAPLCAEQNGYLMDLEFYPPDMPLGGLEFAIVEIIKILAAEGCELLSLGGTYGCKLEPSADADPEIDKILDDLRLQNVFNDAGNLQFKNKFRPESRSIYLCRPVGSGRAENVIDIIMMIADPDKAQVPVEPEPALPSSTPSIRETGRAGQAVIQGSRRSRLLARFGFDPLNIPCGEIEFDLKTDSWAQLEMPEIDAQMQRLHGQLQRPVDVESAVRAVFPFSRLVLTASGQAAERAFFKAWPQTGVVLQNVLFPSTIFHSIDNGFVNEELPHPAAFDAESLEGCKGDLAWEALEARLARDPRAIAFACVDVCNNATGGQPVSLRHLRDLKALLGRHAIPLVIDATRVVENARLLIEREEDCAGKALWDLVRETLACADAVIGSLTKDFCVARGGIVATNDPVLFERVRAQVHQAGGGLDSIDQKLVALSLQARKAIEARVLRRMEGVRFVWQALSDGQAPIMRPAGGHCVLIDVARLPAFRHLANPVASFLAWLYLNTGIRAAAHAVGMQRRESVQSLVRLAIPVGLKRDAVEALTRRLLGALRDPVNVPELELAGKTAGPAGEIHARYRLLGYRNLVGTIEHLTEAALVEEVAEATADVLVGAAPVTSAARLPRGHEPEPGEPERTASAPRKRVGDIAVIGMAGRYPKARSVHELWENLVQGRDCIEEIPAERYERRLRYGAAEKYRGGFVDDVDRFDSLFFNISPREAELLDPQERLFLEVAWEALEDAGYYPEILAGDDGSRDVGVFVGAVWAMYQMLGVEERHAGSQVTPNSFLWSVANRVSYWMNLSGPSLTVDTACSSSLTALYLACDSLQSGACSVAIVGGVNLDLHQAKLDINAAGGALSSDGVCRSFGKGANGYVAGEGVGALVLKPLERALADGDNIQGVIRSIVANHGGRTSGYTVPNPKAQASLILSALRKADVDARSVGYIEAHGTGTALGDPIEIAGLSDAFQAYSAPTRSCAVGSIKTNLGHLEAAAGIVGVAKVLLQMKHRRLVPSLHSAELNEFIDFENSPFYVVQQVEEWTPRDVEGVAAPLRAGISSFGAGGSNAHVIVEHYPAAVVDDGATATAELIFPLSAKTEDQLRDSAARLAAWVRGRRDDPRDVAHTLQVGRKSFDHRLAVVARSAEELADRLSAYLAGAKPEDVVTGHVRSGDAATRLLDRREKQEFVRLLSQRRDPRRLAELWAEGLLADWQGVQERAGRRRVSLPTYPFADQRHWVSPRPASRPIPAQLTASLHPLIDSNESTFDRQIFKKTFHQSDFFIYDHHVGGIPTLPGVAYLELARKAGELAAGRRVRAIRNVVWMSPLVVQGAASTEAFIELVPGEGEVRFEVFGLDGEGNRAAHCQGLLDYAPAHEAPAEAEYIDLDALRARCAKVNEGRNVYPVFKSFGLELGPSFQVLQEVYKNERETLGVLKLPACREADTGGLLLHPSLMDGSLQAGVGAQLGEKVDEMFVPFFIGEVEVLHPLPPTCLSYVTPSRAQSPRVVKSDVTIVDETGKVLVKIRESTGVPLRDLHKKATPEADADGFARLHYGYDWESAPIAPVAADVPGVVVLFDSDEALRDQWQERRRRGSEGAGAPVVLVRPGPAYEEAAGQSYTVDASSAGDFDRLFESLAQSGLALESVCFAWPLRSDGGGDEALARSIERDTYGFLFLCQALIRRKLEGKVQLLHLHAAGADGPRPHNEAIDGFIKTLRLEHPRLLCKTLEVQAGEVERGDVLDVVERELSLRTQDATAVRCAAGARQVRKLQALELDAPERAPRPDGGVLRRQGVYLVTGGGGGLGLLFGEFLAREYDARVILAGRSPLSADSQARVETLRQQGASVLYVRADVCRRDQAQRLVLEGKQRFGRIDGVVHCAGVLRDSALRTKTRDEMDAVLGPKVFGSLHLDELTREEELDFFVMFSSLTALGGNAGQCDYGFANRFMDSLAEQRERLRAQGARRGRTLSINWGLWAGGGMQASAEVVRFLQDNLGMRPLSTAGGLRAFVQALDSGRSQVAILEGLRDKLETAWGLRKPQPARAAAASSPSPAATATAAGAAKGATTDAARSADYARIQSTIVEKLSNVLQMDAASIPNDAPFADFGVNSVMGVEMVRTINEALQIDLDPLKLFEYTTVNELADHVWSTRPGASAPLAEAPPVAETPRTAMPENARGEDPPLARKKRLEDVADAGRRPDARREFGLEPVAVIGMSGRFPQAESLDEFWEHLQAGRDLVTQVTRWEPSHSAMAAGAGSPYCSHGSFVDSIDRFDPSFFGISALEAVWMDPQQRLFLEEAWRALEHAGYAGTGVQEKRCGVYVGCGSSNYERLFTEVPPAEVFWGNAESVIPARIAYYLNLQGPAIAVDTASSSSLVAIHLACQGLWAEETEMALAGGVFLQATPGFFQVTNRAGLLSPDGKCYTFDARANGFVPGEGVGVVVLKRLRDALRDGDHVHAVIAGCGINQNGRSNGLIAPNARAQERLYRAVYERFQIDPETIQMVEANGTGTLLGDSIECQALNRAFRQSTRKTGFCALGSVATNMGHAATAAGVAGLLKVLLALGRRQVPPSLHFERANPAIDLAAGPFYVNTQLREWDAGEHQARRGAVSSFGIGGTNAHVVVEQAPEAERSPVERPAYLLTLSARSAEQLERQARNLLVAAGRESGLALNDMAYTLFVGRMHLGHRLACVAGTREELVELLSCWLEAGVARQVFVGEIADGKSPERVSLTRFGNHCIQECCDGAATATYVEHLATLADLYVQGCPLEFERLFPPGSRRVPLPTYPFADERYWIVARDARQEASAEAERDGVERRSDTVSA